MSLACPVCGSQRSGEPFFELADVPVFCNQLEETGEAARAVPRGQIALVACDACGHVFNREFAPARLCYSPQYDNNLHVSAHFHSWARERAAELVQTYGLHGARAVEPGCGQGDFLELLLEAGMAEGYGFDPGYRPRRLPAGLQIEVGSPPLRLEPAADFLCCRHLLEHLAEPVDFLRRCQGLLRPQARAWLEVPSLEQGLEQGGYWDVLYEHVSWFSAASLGRLCERAGFGVLRSRRSFGGQFLALEAVLGLAGERLPEPPAAEGLAAFGMGWRARLQRWQGELAREPRTLLWGAGSKGVMFRCAVPGGLPMVVDINPRKQGCYLPGSGHRVVAPEALRRLQPSQILVLNAQYRAEIQAMLADLGVTARLQVVA